MARSSQIRAMSLVSAVCATPSGPTLGVVVESVAPVGAVLMVGEHGIAEERQPVAGRLQADHAVPGVWPPARQTTTPCPPRPASISNTHKSLYWHEHRSAFVLDQDHQEFRRLGRACVPVKEMNIVGAFIEGLSRCQCYLFSILQLLHNRAL